MRQVIKSVLANLVSLVSKAIGERRMLRIIRFVGPILRPTVVPEGIVTVSCPSGQTIRFYCMDKLSFWRAETALTKEPETIRWMDHFDAGDVLWDIGANVGIYSLYAAINRSVRVCAFEPSAANYFLLNRNIHENRADAQIKAYCLAFSDANELNDMHMRNVGLGAALNSFGVPIDEAGERYDPVFLQGMIGFRIDDFITSYGLPFPNHIKIDVDGIEASIVAGARTVLADTRLKSVSIEVHQGSPEQLQAITEVMTAAGLRRTDQFKGADPCQPVDNIHFMR